jgi:hypothetical protein
MGVPSPCASRRLGDPAFAHMKRVVCLGARLFSSGFITRHSSERVVFMRTGVSCFSDVVLSGMVERMQVIIMRELRFSNCPASPLPLFGASCTQGLRSNSLHAFEGSPLFQHAVFPFAFPLQVGWMS